MQKLLIFILTVSSILCIEHPVDQKLTPPTPHINAPPCAFSKTVLFPGDPKCARYVAEKFLKDAQLINDVR